MVVDGFLEAAGSSSAATRTVDLWLRPHETRSPLATSMVQRRSVAQSHWAVMFVLAIELTLSVPSSSRHTPGDSSLTFSLAAQLALGARLSRAANSCHFGGNTLKPA